MSQDCEMKFRRTYNISSMQSRTVHNIMRLLDKCIVKKDLSIKNSRDYKDLCDMHDESTVKMMRGSVSVGPEWLYDPRKVKPTIK